MSLLPGIKQVLQQLPKPLWILSLGGLAVFAVATLKPSPEPLPIAQPTPPSVDVWTAQPQAKSLNVYSQGTVAPKREIELVSEVAGRIVATGEGFVDGGFARQGDTLVQIDPRDYELALIQAEARVKDAEQLLATERGRARQAKREWRDLGNVEANQLFLRTPQLAASEAQLASAQADRDKAQLNLERTRISLPFDGRVRSTRVDLGQYVTPGTPIAEVFDTSVAQIRLPLTDRQAALIDLPLGQDPSAPSSFTPPAVSISGVIGGKTLTWQGKLVRTDASIDTRSRLYYAVAEVDQPFTPSATQPTPLLVGLFIEATISGRELDNVVEVPKSALFKRNQLYTLNADNKVQHHTIELLHSEGERAWVRGALPAGTQIITNKQSYLREGLVVRPVDTEPAASEQAHALNQAEG